MPGDLHPRGKKQPANHDCSSSAGCQKTSLSQVYLPAALLSIMKSSPGENFALLSAMESAARENFALFPAMESAPGENFALLSAVESAARENFALFPAVESAPGKLRAACHRAVPHFFFLLVSGVCTDHCVLLHSRNLPFSGC